MRPLPTEDQDLIKKHRQPVYLRMEGARIILRRIREMGFPSLAAQIEDELPHAEFEIARELEAQEVHPSQSR